LLSVVFLVGELRQYSGITKRLRECVVRGFGVSKTNKSIWRDMPVKYCSAISVDGWSWLHRPFLRTRRNQP